MEKIFELLTQIFDQEAQNYEILNPKRIEIHAVYRIPLMGFKDDVDAIIEEEHGTTTLFIRSASRTGAYDLGVNKRRVRRILRKLESRI
jgi:uncharacterized protein (DUF1499 family)